MQGVFEKIIEKLKEYEYENLVEHDSEMANHCKQDCNDVSDCTLCVWDKAIEIVKQEAEKFVPDTNVGNNGWIPCDGVHFPEENVYVRVTIWTETEKIGFRRDGKWFVYGSAIPAEATVLAWQPTQPYHPKGEREA